MIHRALEGAAVLEDRATGYGEVALVDRVTGTAAQTSPTPPSASVKTVDDVQALLKTAMPDCVAALKKVVAGRDDLFDRVSTAPFVLLEKDRDVTEQIVAGFVGTTADKSDVQRIYDDLVTASATGSADRATQRVFAWKDSLCPKGRIDGQMVMHELCHLAVHQTWMDFARKAEGYLNGLRRLLLEGTADHIALLATMHYYGLKKTAVSTSGYAEHRAAIELVLKALSTAPRAQGEPRKASERGFLHLCRGMFEEGKASAPASGPASEVLDVTIDGVALRMNWPQNSAFSVSRVVSPAP